MQAIVVLCLVAVALCQTPPRPVISEDFYAEVRSEYHINEQLLFGEGRWAIDSTQNVGVEDYQFQDNEGHDFFVFSLQRYDLGEVYTINSYNKSYCNSTTVTGQMPATWGWLPYANYTGHKYYHNQYFETWSFSFSGVTLTVGVQAPNYNTPAIYSQSSSGFELFLEFLRFDASTNFNQSFFEVPPQCASEVKPKATPTRPNPSEVFEAATQVEVYQNGTSLYGYGVLASNQPLNMYTEQYDIKDEHGGDIKFFELLRYDLGEAYFISSRDYKDCHSQNVTGNLPAFWSWLAVANYVGQHEVRDHGLLDIWNYVAGGVNVTLAVSDRDVNTPLFLARESSSQAVRYDFTRWSTQTPSATDFIVPPECKN